jgi:hypothetical protein
LRKRRREVRSAWCASAWTIWINEAFMTMVTFLLLSSDLEAAGRRVPGAHPARGGGALVNSGAAARTLRCRATTRLLRRLAAAGGEDYQEEEPTAARAGASSRTTGTTKAWLVGRRRTVVARTVMVGFPGL